MTYYLVKVKTNTIEKIVKISEKEMSTFLNIAFGFGWKLNFIA